MYLCEDIRFVCLSIPWCSLIFWVYECDAFQKVDLFLDFFEKLNLFGLFYASKLSTKACHVRICEKGMNNLYVEPTYLSKLFSQFIEVVASFRVLFGVVLNSFQALFIT